jgi:hypothetical protein
LQRAWRRRCTKARFCEVSGTTRGWTTGWAGAILGCGTITGACCGVRSFSTRTSIGTYYFFLALSGTFWHFLALSDPFWHLPALALLSQVLCRLPHHHALIVTVSTSSRPSLPPGASLRCATCTVSTVTRQHSSASPLPSHHRISSFMCRLPASVFQATLTRDSTAGAHCP